MTWNGDNRFGGGVALSASRIERGWQASANWMDGKRIAIDISHATDKLASEAMNYIDQRGLRIPLIASHSNYRTIHPSARNLPEELVKEIIRRDRLSA